MQKRNRLIKGSEFLFFIILQQKGPLIGVSAEDGETRHQTPHKLYPNRHIYLIEVVLVVYCCFS